MATLAPPAADGLLEECIDELSELTARLERFPETTLAFALRAHLGGLLLVLLERQHCTREEARQFVAGLEAEVLAADR